MQTTLNLLETALQQRNASEWATRLHLTASALRTARARGHLSPAIAGALAEEMGEDVEAWIVRAAMESERESACKTRMLKRLRSREKPSFYGASKGPNTGRRGCRRGSLGRSICNTTRSTTQNLTSRRLAISVFVSPLAHQRATCAR